MDIPVLSGRNFRKEDVLSGSGVYIFNETAQKKYNFEIGEILSLEEEAEFLQDKVIGNMPDIKFFSFRNEITPMAFYLRDGNYKYAYIRINVGVDMDKALAHITQSLNDIDPDFPVEIRFYDTILSNLYKQERNLGMLISLFSLVAIFISMVGVFGLVVFDSEYRRKEIGLRKVHEATTANILMMFNKSYIRVLISCFIIAMPIAFYGVTRWLENFAYKTPLYWWVFALSFVVVALITVSTVTFQSFQMANANPIESIKNE